MQGLAGVVGELAALVDEEGRAVEGRISIVGRSAFVGHGRSTPASWVLISQNPRTVAADACRGLWGSWANWLQWLARRGGQLKGRSPRRSLVDAP